MGYEKVGILGFSAGGHLTCSAGTMYNFEAYELSDDIDKLSARPDAFIPCYPVVSFVEEYSHFGSRDGLFGEDRSNYALARRFSCEKNVTKDTPPCFMWHCEGDKVVDPANTYRYAMRLLELGVSHELHIYPRGGHGIGLVTEERFAGHEYMKSWGELLLRWFKLHEFF
jgi:acetyl esterase/lipase